ncbi:hypothetical protein DPX16_8174 [Anabarilius grahami]|uniref:Uncharacterized protein n=1 Tax=Anabarilius grahami TaxID=495550 RepID=A0A3N0YUX7_ANAGA|nr:hypothetical protein DPX16_8174 [Anabarilius grahami]
MAVAIMVSAASSGADSGAGADSELEKALEYFLEQTLGLMMVKDLGGVLWCVVAQWKKTMIVQYTPEYRLHHVIILWHVGELKELLYIIFNWAAILCHGEEQSGWIKGCHRSTISALHFPSSLLDFTSTLYAITCTCTHTHTPAPSSSHPFEHTPRFTHCPVSFLRSGLLPCYFSDLL